MPGNVPFKLYPVEKILRHWKFYVKNLGLKTGNNSQNKYWIRITNFSINTIKLLTYILALTLLVSINSNALTSKTIGQDWLQEEHDEKVKILESFWQERIVKYDKKAVDTFMNFLINSHFPKDITWQTQIENLFQAAIDKKIDFKSFFIEINKFPLVML